jgi:transglutaminase-like putative cysteine protease
MPSTAVLPTAPRPVPGPEYLVATRFLDYEAPELRSFARDAVAGETDAIAKAVKLFYAVRDRWRYDPFSMTLEADDYLASRVFARSAAYCLPKAILLAGSARAVGMPRLRSNSSWQIFHSAVVFL